MNKRLMKKEALVSLLKLATNPLEELSKFRFDTIKELANNARGCTFFMYLEEGMPTLSEYELCSFTNDAIVTKEGIATKMQNNWTHEEQRMYELSELKSLIELVNVCNAVQQELIEESYSFKFYLRPGINETEFLDSFTGLKGNDFGRCLQKWCIQGAIKKSCKGSELHRALCARLPNVPTVQTLNKALRLEIPDKRKERF